MMRNSEDMINEILEDANFKATFDNVKQNFRNLFDKLESFGFSLDETLAFAQGINSYNEAVLYDYLLPVWFDEWAESKYGEEHFTSAEELSKELKKDKKKSKKKSKKKKGK